MTAAITFLHQPQLQLSEDQRAALDTLLERIGSGQQETILVGAAGTGKTTVMRALLAELGRFPVCVCPTWKAALRFSEVTGYGATSIHRLVYGPPLREEELEAMASGEDEGVRERGRPQLVFKLAPGEEFGKVARGTLLIVDEASMVGSKVYADLMRVVRANDAQVLFIGDKEQLQPVNDTWGVDFESANASLTRVHRQAAGSSVLAFATAVREGKRLLGWEGYDASCRWERTLSTSQIEDFFRAAQELGGVALSYSNNTRQRLNRTARRALGLTGVALRPGEPLLSFANKGPLVNGEMVTVQSVLPEAPPMLRDTGVNVWSAKLACGGERVAAYVAPESLCATGRGGRQKALKAALEPAQERLKTPWLWGDGDLDQYRLKVEMSRVVEVEHGYACTVHKAQGSQWPQVLVVIDESFRRAGEREGAGFARRWLYTAATRAEEKLILGSVR